MNEFELIERFFTRPVPERQGVGDDCALIDVADRTLAITADLLIEHTHFFPGADPASLGHKALAVNLSDLAAAGARPRCFLLSLSVPHAQPDWLQAFSDALYALAEREGCAWVGGDTTRAPRIGPLPGPITIGITALGEVERATLRGRGGARVGDDLWVSGELGDAALAVAHRRGQLHLSQAQAQACQGRLDWPQARVALGLQLRGLAHCAIDVSDGLLADLGHLLRRSGVGATVLAEQVPHSECLRQAGSPWRWRCALAGGDDYELLFTASPDNRALVDVAGARCCIAVKRIGTITRGSGIELVGAAGFDATLQGYDHFAGTSASEGTD